MAGILRAGMIIMGLLLGWWALVHVANAQPADCVPVPASAEKLQLDVAVDVPSLPASRHGSQGAAMLGLNDVPANGTTCVTQAPRPVQDVLRGAPDAEMLKLQP